MIEEYYFPLVFAEPSRLSNHPILLPTMKIPALSRLSRSKHARGFTLIELLVVVAIIALLAAGSVGGYGKIMNMVKSAASKKLAVEIAGGVTTYYSDYDTFPVGDAGSDHTSEEGSEIYAILTATGDDAKTKNSRKINYLDGMQIAKPGKGGGNPEGGIDYESGSVPQVYDSWGNEFTVITDNNIDGKIDNPDGRDGQPSEVRGKKVLVFSPGRKGENGDINTNWSDYIKTW